jgi:uncharacterized BrkB/YihY/UPF0761 family membrane protein
VVERAGDTGAGWITATFSILFLLFASTRLFWMLRAALNHAWGVRSRIPPGFRGLRWKVLRRRLIAFGMVGVLGAALIVAALVKTGLSATAAYFGGVPIVYRIIDIGASIALFSVLTALIYRWLPDARIGWRDVFVGATLTSFLATGASFLIGHYVARVSPGSMYGAAGSMIVLLLWVYYTAQIFFFGAEVTAAYAKLRGRGVEPLEHATRIITAEQHPILEGFELVDEESPEDEANRRGGGERIGMALQPDEAHEDGRQGDGADAVRADADRLEGPEAPEGPDALEGPDAAPEPERDSGSTVAAAADA